MRHVLSFLFDVQTLGCWSNGKEKSKHCGGKQKFNENVHAVVDDHLSNLSRIGLMHHALSFMFDVQLTCRKQLDVVRMNF